MKANWSWSVAVVNSHEGLITKHSAVLDAFAFSFCTSDRPLMIVLLLQVVNVIAINVKMYKLLYAITTITAITIKTTTTQTITTATATITNKKSRQSRKLYEPYWEYLPLWLLHVLLGERNLYEKYCVHAALYDTQFYRCLLGASLDFITETVVLKHSCDCETSCAYITQMHMHFYYVLMLSAFNVVCKFNYVKYSRSGRRNLRTGDSVGNSYNEILFALS
uniref:Uncharacterized protein n=1 Tax=Glossina austeni TaxID=7395 RepID=A0A1A9UVX3_GLOAU